MKVSHLILFLGVSLLSALGSCGTEAPPMGQALTERDSLPVMTVRGVSKLISDSGVVRYKIVAEEWLIYDKTTPPRQDFLKGIFLMRLDEQFNVDLFISADTAYCYDQKLWELRGRVRINNKKEGTKFSTEELFWDMQRREMYSHKYIRIVTPDRELEGNSFTSNEQLTRYTINWASGKMPMKTNPMKEDGTAQDATATDSLTTDSIGREAPRAKRSNS